MPPQNNHSDEAHPHFPSGEWEGFYNYDYNPDHKTPMRCYLNFRAGQVKGSGSDDDIGVFSWTGHYDSKIGRCKMIKSYPGQHQVHYDGHADENGIWGKWYIPPVYSGGFHIKPKGSGALDTYVEALVEEKELAEIV